MSDETVAPTAAPSSGPATAAPEAPATEAPEKAPEQTEGGTPDGGQEPARQDPPKTASEARQRLKDRARGRKTPSRSSEAGEGEESVASKLNRGDPGLPRDQQGKWRSPEAETDTQESDVGLSDEAPAGTTQPKGAPQPDGGTEVRGSDGQAPEGMVRIPLPEGHPLTHKGVTHLDFPAQNEQYGRWAVNQGMRAQEFEAQKRQMREAQERSEAARAESQFWQQHAGEFFGPEFYQTYNDLKETYGEDRAEYYKAGVLAKAQEQVREVQEQARNQVRNREVVRGAKEFRSMAQRAVATAQQDPANPAFVGWTPRDVDQALAQYGQWMEANGRKQYDPTEFRKIATSLYMRHPEGRKRLAADAQRKQQEMREQMKREAEAEVRTREQERLREAAEGRRRNPLQRVPNVETGRQSIGDSGESPQSAREMRERIRQRARGTRR